MDGAEGVAVGAAAVEVGAEEAGRVEAEEGGEFGDEEGEEGVEEEKGDEGPFEEGVDEDRGGFVGVAVEEGGEFVGGH